MAKLDSEDRSVGLVSDRLTVVGPSSSNASEFARRILIARDKCEVSPPQGCDLLLIASTLLVQRRID